MSEDCYCVTCNEFYFSVFDKDVRKHLALKHDVMKVSLF